MRIGVPKEVKNHEYRIAIIRPAYTSCCSEEYLAAGAKILDTADDVWETGEDGQPFRPPWAA